MTINFSDAKHTDRYLIYGKDRFVVRSAHAAETLSRAGLTAMGSPFVAARSAGRPGDARQAPATSELA
jgi:biotin synthase